MLFSALVDTDFLDTEAHYTGAMRKSVEFRPAELLQWLIAEKESKSRSGELNAIRNRIFQLVPTDIDIQKERGKLHFRKVAEAARVIKDETQPVILPYRKGRDIERCINRITQLYV
jgi:hypothetical protein